jgi:glycosyltransferase involved in cell wall biosynthesis
MIKVLVVANGVPARPHVFVDSLRRLAATGASVSVVGAFPAGRLTVPDRLAGVRTLAPMPTRLRTRKLTPSESLWLRLRRDTTARRAAARADVIVALDPASVHTVWQLARRHPGADAVLGLTPAIRTVEARAASRVRHAARRLLVRVSAVGTTAPAVRGLTARHGRSALRAATGTRVHRIRIGRLVWQVALRTAPGPARIPLARRVAESLTRAGYPDRAAATLTAAAKRLPRADRRAAFLADIAKRELAHGRSPACLPAAAAAELALADAAHARHDHTEAARSVRRASQLLFHRGAHLDGLESPAAPDPTRFLAPWHASAVGRALATPRGRTTTAAAPAGRPHRMLFLYNVNGNFLTEIRHRYAHRPHTEVRSLDIRTDDVLRDAATHPVELIEHLLAGSSPYGDRLAAALRPHLDWADTIWVDWCTQTAALLTAVDPGSARIVLRLHSVEAFTEWPHLIDHSRIDDLVYVSEHLRDYTTTAVPRLGGPGAPRSSVLTNAMDLRGYQRPKPDSARFTVGLVGISSVAKDPRWAVQVLRHLRERDDRYRLLLIGGDLSGERSHAGRRYRRRFEADLRDLEPSGAVRRLGATGDVAAALTEVGVILSSSVRESFHCGLVEGAASQAVPVVRDWPYFAGRPTSARTLFPADWVVDSPQAAAERILAVTATGETWRRAGAAAAAHALATWDWQVTAPTYDRLLFGA